MVGKPLADLTPSLQSIQPSSNQTANNISCQVFSKFPPISTNAVRAMCGWLEVGPILAVADIAVAVIATRQVMADGEVVGDRLLLFCMHGITSCGIDRYFLPAHISNVKE